jgi:hypothetical protein
VPILDRAVFANFKTKENRERKISPDFFLSLHSGKASRAVWIVE